MSSHSVAIDLSAEARTDLEHIVLHSLNTWGEEQARSYQAALDKGLQDIARFPNLGRERNDLGIGLRNYRVKQHVIIYTRINNDIISIVRVLHVRMEPADHLGS